MSQKLNIGLAKKLGLPDYGSLCASCHVEFELGESLSAGAERFSKEVRQAFSACSQAVNEELERQQQTGGALCPRAITGGGAIAGVKCLPQVLVSGGGRTSPPWPSVAPTTALVAQRGPQQEVNRQRLAASAALLK